MNLTDRQIRNFWAKVDKSGDCWLWLGTKTTAGYGCIRYQQNFEKALYMAHRLAYELLIGSIPEGLTLDHLCRNPPCVNPAHLDPCGPGENARRANQAGYFGNPNTCRRGHDWDETPPATFRDPRYTKRRRECRICMRERARLVKPDRICPECEGVIPGARRADAEFCSPRCQLRSWKRRNPRRVSA
jgi:hypothetical protein